jgi:hypothetical protein
MTGPDQHFRQAGAAALFHLRDSLKEFVQMFDLLIEGLAAAASWIGRAMGPKAHAGKGRQRSLQAIRAMSMVSEHVLRDVGLDRAAIGAISELSAEEIHGCRVERQVA